MMVFRAGEQEMEEGSITAPDTAYGISKLLAEQELLAWARECPQRRLRIIRPGVVFGRGENGNFTRMYRALKRGVFAFVGRRTTVKSCVYVKDVVGCLQFLMEDSGGNAIYNLALPELTNVQYIADAFFDVFHFRRWIPTVPFSVAYMVGGAGEVLLRAGVRTAVHRRRIQKLYHSTHISSDALRNAGFQFQYDLREGLADWRQDCLPEDLY
jgi:nucleoside-diphosphate-sugar epimerase